MAKFVKLIISVCVAVGSVLLVAPLTGCESDESSTSQPAKKQSKKGGGVQPQEKYGFAPMGDE